jgi:hypothetical protein
VGAKTVFGVWGVAEGVGGEAVSNDTILFFGLLLVLGVVFVGLCVLQAILQHYEEEYQRCLSRLEASLGVYFERVSDTDNQPPADAGLCSECGRTLPGEGNGVCETCEEG